MICNFSFFGTAKLYAGTDNIPVFQGHLKTGSGGHSLSYSFAKGDKIQITYQVEKNKALKLIQISDANTGMKLYAEMNQPTGNILVNIKDDGVYTIKFATKSLGKRMVKIDIMRIPGGKKYYNTAYYKHNEYTPEEVNYQIDTMLGYQPVITNDTIIPVFNKYYYQNIKFKDINKQILGQAGVHNSQAAGYNIGLDKSRFPRNAKLKCMTYSVSSVLGGAKHWSIANTAVTIGCVFINPAAAFAANSAMSIIGPEPGNEPVQYFLSARESDIGTVKEIYRPYNRGRKITNKGKDFLSKGFKNVGLDRLSNATSGTKVKEYSEADLCFDQKGKVTQLFVMGGAEPNTKMFIMANPERTQAKNTHLETTAIFYAPTYRKIKAKRYIYKAQLQKLEKSKTKYNKSSKLRSIDF
jgi:hypothetical protein